MIQLHIQLLIVIVVEFIMFGGIEVDANVKKVLLQLPKKPKQVHHHHHYLLMDPVAGATQIGRYEHTLPRSTVPHMGPNNVRQFSADMGPNNVRQFSADMGLPYHVPLYLGHSTESHGDIMDLHTFVGPNNMRHMDTFTSYNLAPPPTAEPTQPPPLPPIKKQKIIRKMPMKMDTVQNHDYFNDTPLYKSFTNDHPVFVHKPFSDHHTGYRIHQNYNPHSIVQHIFTEEIQTPFK